MSKKTLKRTLSSEMIIDGKLFGLPLTHVASEDGKLPNSIELFRRGPGTLGIFRKAGSMKHMKLLKQSLDSGKDVNFEEKSAVLLGTLIKEYFRSLPNCPFGSEFYEEYLATRATEGVNQRSEDMKQIFNKLPKAHLELVKKFTCLLHHISNFSERNKMDSYNLATCVAPSVLRSPVNGNVALLPDEMKALSEVVQFCIDNFKNIFGDEALTCLGEEHEIELEPVDSDESENLLDQGYTSRNSSVDALDDVDANGGIDSLFNQSTDPLKRFKPVKRKVRKTRSNPSSPHIRRKSSLDDNNNGESNFLDGTSTGFRFRRRRSSQDNTDVNGNYDYWTLGNRRAKRMLSSSANSAELIKHERPSYDRPSTPTSPLLSESLRSLKIHPPIDHPAFSPVSSPKIKRKHPLFSGSVSYNTQPRPAPSYEESVEKLRSNRKISPDFQVYSTVPFRRRHSDESFSVKRASVLHDIETGKLEQTPTKAESGNQLSKDDDDLGAPKREVSYSSLKKRLNGDWGDKSEQSPESGIDMEQPKSPPYDSHMQKLYGLKQKYLLKRTESHPEGPTASTADYNKYKTNYGITANLMRSNQDPLGLSLDSSTFKALQNHSKALHRLQSTQRLFKMSDELASPSGGDSKDKKGHTIIQSSVSSGIIKTNQHTDLGIIPRMYVAKSPLSSFNVGTPLSAQLITHQLFHTPEKVQINNPGLNNNIKEFGDSSRRCLKHNNTNEVTGSSSGTYSSISDELHDIESISQEDMRRVLYQAESYV